MAREITRTLILEGHLVACGPLHVGGADSGHESDMALAVDGKGRCYLPGTSLAGAIRAWECAADDDARWGFTGGSGGGHASFIVVDDAPAQDDAAVELWHGVGIDRITGTAASGIKFDRQVLPAGTRFAFRLQCDIAKDASLDEGRAWMARLRDALMAGRISFGAGTTRGLGSIRLEQHTQHEVDWTSRASLLRHLQGKTDAAQDSWDAGREGRSRAVHIRVHWRPLGPVMGKSARDGSAVDALPFTSGVCTGQKGERELAMTLPGSSIKGALRSHAERIVRTVLGIAPVGLDDGGSMHLDQVSVPLVEHLFGSARPAKNDSRTLGGKGRLRVATCYSRLVLRESEWERLANSSDAWASTGWDPGKQLYRADHVAVDRWTGGAADGLLFSAVEPAASVKWDPMELVLQASREDTTEMAALLWLVLRDLCEGRIPIGYGQNRGYGAIAVDRIELDGLDALGAQLPTATLQASGGRLDESAVGGVVENLKNAWTAWLARQEAAK